MEFSNVFSAFEQHFNVRFLGGEAVDLKFQFSAGVDFKDGFEKLQYFEGVAQKEGILLKGDSDTRLTIFA